MQQNYAHTENINTCQNTYKAGSGWFSGIVLPSGVSDPGSMPSAPQQVQEMIDPP